MLNQRILLIDDDPECLQMMKETLVWEGYCVDVASSGQEAMDKIDHQPCPVLVLLDVNMPGLDGMATLKQLKENMQHVSTIFVSGKSETETIIRGLDAGADDYICKPFNPMELLARVRAQLRIKSLHDKLQEANAKLENLVNIDDLTGLFNMRSLYTKLDHELERTFCRGGFASVLMMDMDNFKDVNDQNDHLFGSYVLSQVGKVLRENTRKVDFASRYGGDEFLIVLTDTDLIGTIEFAERLRVLLENMTFSNDGCSIRMTISIGLAVVGPGQIGMDSKALIKYADRALYQAKAAGRNCVKYHRFPDQKKTKFPRDHWVLKSPN